MTMQPYELGDTELTGDQREAFERMIDMIAARYPGRDHGQHPDGDCQRNGGWSGPTRRGRPGEEGRV